jgi:hypothetical protein
MEVLRSKNVRKERRFGNFDITKPMLRGNVNAGLLSSDVGRSIRRSLRSGKVQQCKLFCYGSMLNSRRYHQAQWSLAL